MDALCLGDLRPAFFALLDPVAKARLSAVSPAMWKEDKETLAPDELCMIKTIRDSGMSLRLVCKMRHTGMPPNQLIRDVVRGDPDAGYVGRMPHEWRILCSLSQVGAAGVAGSSHVGAAGVADLTAQGVVAQLKGAFGDVALTFNVLRDAAGRKITPADEDVFMPQEAIKALTGLLGDTYSIHLHHCRDTSENVSVICIDFDTKELAGCKLYDELCKLGCLRSETVKGYHVYVLLQSARPPAVKKCVKVLRDARFPVDLLTGDHVNVWEPVDRAFTGKLVSMDWETLEPFFNVEIVPEEDLARLEAAKQEYIDTSKHVGRPLPRGLGEYEDAHVYPNGPEPEF